MLPPVSYQRFSLFLILFAPRHPRLSRPLPPPPPSCSRSRSLFVSRCSFTPHTLFVLCHRLSHALSPHLCLLTHIAPYIFLLFAVVLSLLLPSRESRASSLPRSPRAKRKCIRWKACTQSLLFPRLPFAPISDIPAGHELSSPFILSLSPRGTFRFQSTLLCRFLTLFFPCFTHSQYLSIFCPSSVLPAFRQMRRVLVTRVCIVLRATSLSRVSRDSYIVNLGVSHKLYTILIFYATYISCHFFSHLSKSFDALLRDSGLHII